MYKIDMLKTILKVIAIKLLYFSLFDSDIFFMLQSISHKKYFRVLERKVYAVHAFLLELGLR